MRRRNSAGGLCLKLLLCVVVGLWVSACERSSPPGAGPVREVKACEGERWVAAWGAAPQASSLISVSGLAVQEIRDALLYQAQNFPNVALAQFFSNQSLRQIVAPNLGGQALRLRFGNRFQNGALQLSDVFVGLAGEGAMLLPGSNRPVTFGGQTSVLIEPGMEMLSDPVVLEFEPPQALAVSLHLPGPLVPVDYHLTAQQISYMSVLPGSYSAREDAATFTTTLSSWYVLNAVEVLAPASMGIVVALGDSLTDGYQSSYGSNSRWTDFLAGRLRARSSAQPMTVVNAGISGNNLVADNPVFGPSGVTRFTADVLNTAGVTDVIVFEGINDIGGVGIPATAEAIIEGYRATIRAAHSAGLNVIGATLTPSFGTLITRHGWPGAPQKLRQDVNSWIRGSGEFDAVIDFEAAVRDQDDPRRIDPRYNSGDNLHLNDEGYRVLAETVDLTLLKGRKCR